MLQLLWQRKYALQAVASEASPRPFRKSSNTFCASGFCETL